MLNWQIYVFFTKYAICRAIFMQSIDTYSPFVRGFDQINNVMKIIKQITFRESNGFKKLADYLRISQNRVIFVLSNSNGT